MIRSAAQSVFPPVNLLDKDIPLALATYNILFKLNRLDEYFYSIFRFVGYALLFSKKALKQVPAHLVE